MNNNVILLKISKFLGRKLLKHECIQISKICKYYGKELVYQVCGEIKYESWYLNDLKKCLDNRLEEMYVFNSKNNPNQLQSIDEFIFEIKKDKHLVSNLLEKTSSSIK